MVDLLIEISDHHFGQAGFEQIAAAQAGGLALRGHADFDVEAVAFLDAGPQIALNQDQRYVVRG